MIEVTGLTKYYGSLAAIRNVSFRVEQGEIVGFLGPNGAGKTTTMRILTGYSPPTSGAAMIAGYDIGVHPMKVKRQIGYLPESVPLYSEMVVRSFLRYVAEVKGIVRGARRAEVDRVIERCGVGAVADRVIRNLSKGYRQRVGLAQALIGNPPVLILDEPTVGLDPRQIIEIRQMIRELATEHTVLLSTHILPEVAMVCQRVIIIHRGQVVAGDTMANLTGQAAGAVLEVEAAGPEADVRRLLEKLPGATGIIVEGAGRYRVEGADANALSEAAARALAGAGLGVRGLRTRARTLEDVFLEAIASDEGDAPCATSGQ